MLRQTISDSLARDAPARARFANDLAEFERMFPRDPPDQARLLQLHQQLDAANKLAPGDYVELGVLFGQTLKFIHRRMDPERELYGFDTFVGFDARDIAVERGLYPCHWRGGDFFFAFPDWGGGYLVGPNKPQQGTGLVAIGLRPVPP